MSLLSIPTHYFTNVKSNLVAAEGDKKKMYCVTQHNALPFGAEREAVR